jgi:hypothetical protein
VDAYKRYDQETAFKGGDGTKMNLAIAVDGGQHFTDSHQKKDANRDAYLATFGIKTLRFTNAEILKHCTEVLSHIEHSIVSVTSFEGGRERFLRAGGCQM